MIDVDGRLLNPAHIISAEIETRHCVNGSASQLVVVMVDGTRVVKEHRWGGFDAYAALARIRETTK